jgi:excisionase family DNA binding protein
MKKMPEDRAYLSPPQYAKQLGIQAEKVLRWIRSGELKAVNVAQNSGVGRPRWRISAQEIQRFELSRSNTSPPQRPRRARRKPDKGGPF